MRRAGDLSGEGARRAGGRWNERGIRALYAGSSTSLALLEILAHVEDRRDLPEAYAVTVIEVANPPTERIPLLPGDRRACQTVGSDMLRGGEILGFWVPSVIVPREWNLVLNPGHRAFEREVTVAETYALPVDLRLRS